MSKIWTTGLLIFSIKLTIPAGSILSPACFLSQHWSLVSYILIMFTDIFSVIPSLTTIIISATYKGLYYFFSDFFYQLRTQGFYLFRFHGTIFKRLLTSLHFVSLCAIKWQIPPDYALSIIALCHFIKYPFMITIYSYEIDFEFHFIKLNFCTMLSLECISKKYQDQYASIYSHLIFTP